MRIIAAMLGGFILDWIFGDPAWLVHPVVIMGKAISALEAFLEKHLPNTPKGERMGGLFLAMTLPVGTRCCSRAESAVCCRRFIRRWICGRAALVHAGVGGDRTGAGKHKCLS